jgi:hypothetical protein
LDSDSKPNDNISLPRNIKVDGMVDSVIVNSNIISIISRWIDKVDINNNFSHLRELYLPYEFKLLLRGKKLFFSSLQPYSYYYAFSFKEFHELCDSKHNTVTFIKVERTGEILGGYNPSIWKNSGGWGQTKYSFIFSFKNKNNFKYSILSHVKNMDKALIYCNTHGPSFGSSDLELSRKEEHQPYNRCKQADYEKRIRDTEDEFSIESYEVFQIIKNPNEF